VEAAFEDAGSPLTTFLRSPPLWLNQVHGNNVVDFDDVNLADARTTVFDADAAVTTQPFVTLAILTADCLPVVFAAPGVIGAAHAGWRGLNGGVLENTVGRMNVMPDRISAWLGPAISQAAFEVGHDVRDAFLASAAEFDLNEGDVAACFAPDGDKFRADLYALARLRLRRLGVTRISGGDCCTYTDSARFYSYRRDKTTGRMGTFVAINN
jgi:YfiH family protein